MPPNSVRSIVEEHHGRTQAQMAQLWGEDVTQQNISDALQKIGFTQKKTYGYRERDEEARLEFIERLKEKDPDQIVSLFYHFRKIKEGYSNENSRY